MFRIVSTAAISLLCAACASNGDAIPGTEVETSPIANTGLSAQTLGPGECGLFLWTATTPRKFVFFSKAGTDEALVDLGGEAVTMARTSADGDIFGQFMTDMRFDPGEGRGSLSVFIEPGTLLEQGQRTEKARLTFTNAEGWETIVPVAGVRACQNPS